MTKRREKTKSGASRAAELIDFLQAVALGKRNATEAEVKQAASELDDLVSDEESRDA